MIRKGLNHIPMRGHPKFDTSGFRAWWPVYFFNGRKNGEIQMQEGYRNTVTGEEFIPPEGHNADPPCPSGDLATIRHMGGNSEFWTAMAEAGKKVRGEVVKQGNGRTVIRYD